jgi:hypothetical protein
MSAVAPGYTATARSAPRRFAPVHRRFAVAAIATTIAAAAAAPSPAAPGVVTTPVTAAAAVATAASSTAHAIPPYNQTVAGSILPLSRELLVRLSKEGRALSLDGVPVFNGDDKFLPGKIALSLAEFLVTVPSDDPRRAEYIAGFRRISKLTVDDANDSWGISTTCQD